MHCVQEIGALCTGDGCTVYRRWVHCVQEIGAPCTGDRCTVYRR